MNYMQLAVQHVKVYNYQDCNYMQLAVQRVNLCNYQDCNFNAADPSTVYANRWHVGSLKLGKCQLLIT